MRRDRGRGWGRGQGEGTVEETGGGDRGRGQGEETGEGRCTKMEAVHEASSKDVLSTVWLPTFQFNFLC